MNPPRIMAVCQIFRDRHETPKRLADAIDDPMPVETGDPMVDGVTTTAIQRLTGRFDEFGEAMRRDAAGLVATLQRYRATEAATLRELEEVARSLAVRPGTTRPVLPVVTPDSPPAVQPPAALRTRTWETVEPPAGAGCSRRLGQPEGIRALAQALHQAGNGMNDLIGMLRRQLDELVPTHWNGEGATAFKQQIAQQLGTGTTAVVERSRKVGDAANKFADRLHGAWVTFAEAQVLAIRFDITIRPNALGDCMVYPNGPDTREKRAATERCLHLVGAAVREAVAAQAEFRMALTETYEDRLEIWRPVLVSGAVGALAAARARARGRTRTQAILAQLEAILRSAPRTRLGNVGPVPRHLLDANGQLGTAAGNHMHARIADLLKQQYPGVRFEVRVRPGETGVDLRVRGLDRGVRDPGFDYLEIKPESASGIRQFVQNQWGMPDFQGRGRMITYNTNGDVFRVDTPHPF